MADTPKTPDLTKLLADQQAYLEAAMEIEEGLGRQYAQKEKDAAQARIALELQKEMYRLQSQGQQATEDAAKEIEKTLKKQKGLSDQERKFLENKKALLDALALDSNNFEADRKKALEEQIKAGNKRLAQLDEELGKIAKMPGAVENATKKWAALFGIGKKAEETMIGGLGTMLSNIGQTGASMKKMWQEGMVGGAYLGILENVLMGQEKLYANFIKSTGANASLAEATLDASDSLRHMGLGMEEAFAASQNLMDANTMFRTGTQETQKELILFTAELQKAGIQGNAAAKAMEFFGKTMGMGKTEMKAATTQLIQFGRSLNMNANQFLSEFNQLMPELAAHGQDAEKVFKELAITAQQTGISLSNLMSIAAQYDTFESSAKAVSRMNAVLGGPYLNSVEMVYATEAERLEMLHKTLTASGKSFDSMSRFEKKAFAQASGFKSVAEASNFFNTSLEVQRAEQEAAAEKQKTMNDLAREAMPIMEELRMTMMQVAVSLKPVFQFLSKIIKGLSTFLGMAEGAPAKLGAFIFVGYKLVKLFNAMRWSAIKAAIAKAALSPWTVPVAIAAAGAMAAFLATSTSGGGGEGGGEEDEAPTLAIGNPMNRALRGKGAVVPAKLHAGELVETGGGTTMLPKYGTAVHTAQTAGNLAQSTQQMANAVAGLPGSLAGIMKPVDKQIMLGEQVLAEFVGDQVNEKLSIMNRAG